MIGTLASPAVCVIDDEPADYEPILHALIQLNVWPVHLRGDLDSLPPHPFSGLRLLFTDLHLSGTVGKAAASHAANVFLKVVPPETAPVIVVIWSKFGADITGEPGTPAEDQETESELFKRTLLEAEPKYDGRLIFVDMEKPKAPDRPEDWTARLQSEIEATLTGKDAIKLLWGWESLVRQASTRVSEELTSLTRPADELASGQPAAGASLSDGLKDAMRALARAQAEGDSSASTAPRHVATVLSQLLVDQLEHLDGLYDISSHGAWLAAPPDATDTSGGLASRLNGFLLTAASSATPAPFLPGTVYDGVEDPHFEQVFGVRVGALAFECWSKRRHASDVAAVAQKEIDKADLAYWRTHARPVLVELSAACDVAQSTRRSAVLIAGLVLPVTAQHNSKRGEAFQRFPNFYLRWPATGFPAQDVVLMFCSRYKVTYPNAAVPVWLKPWFRLRENPTASLRNWYASQSARIGYVSLED